MGTGAQGGYYAVMTWMPTFLRNERGLSILDSTGYLAVLIVGAFCGYLSGGFLSDRIGRRSMKIARQSVVAGMSLSIVAMVVAAFGYLPPVAGALLQEGIDIAVILNALRALRP